MRFEFSRHHDGAAASSFDLGDLRLVLDSADVSSAGHRPSRSMMIYLAIVHLVDGLSEMAEGHSSRFRFVGPDSSFSLDFRRKNDVLTVTAGNALVGAVPMSEVLAALLAGITTFLTDPDNALAANESVVEDLESAVRRLRGVASSSR
ncbi:hypothetical protein AB0A95_03975 [Micromonospora sp. NPDC049230]|uniref:hypothetical protein n=1 Tax=Micromonospora sp. NPDC049230 TaxID=3155502 RepID=UPI0033FAF28F